MEIIKIIIFVMFMNKESLQNYLIENSPDSHTLILLELKKNSTPTTKNKSQDLKSETKRKYIFASKGLKIFNELFYALRHETRKCKIK